MAETRLAAKSYLTPWPSLQFVSEGEQAPQGQNLYPAMLAFAVACLEREMTQTAADTLAFLLGDPDVSATVRDEAADILDELESRICPRIILDARVFADGMDLRTMLEYLLDHINTETT